MGFYVGNSFRMHEFQGITQNGTSFISSKVQSTLNEKYTVTKFSFFEFNNKKLFISKFYDKKTKLKAPYRHNFNGGSVNDNHSKAYSMNNFIKTHVQWDP